MDNTTLADGTALKVVAKAGDAPEEITRGTTEAEPNNHWHWREGAGSGAGAKRGVFAAAGTKGNNAPMLRTLIVGLKPKTNYQVHGFFWIAGTHGDQAKPLGDQLWDIRFGISMASMRGFGYACQAGLPDTIGMDMSPPLVFRQMDAPLRSPSGEPKVDHEDDRCLFRALLGVARTDAKGTLVVSIDDQAHDTNQGRTWYDGIGVIAAPDATAEVGANAPGALALAVRAGDWDMMRRELAAGADPNALDPDALTPLYYLCVAGDRERVAALLQAGAKPDVNGQKFPPLCAAALAGDEKLTKTLLDAGAKTTNLEEPTWVQQRSLSNPVEAALCSGSVEVLRLILAQTPDLDLEHTVYGKIFDSKNPSEFDRSDRGLVKSSLETGCGEMAAFLINRGCLIDYREDSNVPSWRFGRGSQTLMLKAVMNHPPMLGVIEALTKRGVPLILTRELEYDTVVVPWDALSGAVWEGQTTLVSQWLPKAAKASEDYRIRLTVLAESCGNPAVLEMVRKQFPKVKLPPYPHPFDPVEVGRAKASGPKDRFQPRVLAAATRSKPNGKKVLAVISSPTADGPASALAAKASELPSWTVVEREEIHKLLTEKSLAEPTTVGTTELSAIGDRLSADIFIIVSRFGNGDAELLEFEAANVRTGLLFDRLIVAAKEFNSDTFCGNYLARVRSKLDSQNGAAAPAGITLLDISADPNVPQGRTLANLLHAGMLQEIDSTPGLIALTREQMEPLATEKLLKQSGALWGAAWTLEGGLSPGEGDQVVLAVRLRSLGRDPISHDVKVAGSPEYPQVMVQEAWRKLAILIGNGEATATATTPEQRAATEAARLLREAEWLAASPKVWEAIPIIDAALYLGADPMKALRLRMRIHWDSLHFGNPRLQFGSVYDSNQAWGYPLWPEFHDYARRWVSEQLEFLRLTSETLDRTLQILKEQPNGIRNESFQDFWLYWDCLAKFRSQLVPAHLNPEQLAALKEFDAELEALCKRLLPLVKSPSTLGELLSSSEHFTQHFRVIPWLGRLIAGEIVRTWPAEQDVYLTPLFTCPAFPQLEPACMGVIADLLEQAMRGKDLRFGGLRKAELGVLRSTGTQQRDAARTLAHARIDAMAASLVPPSRWASNEHSRGLLPSITSNKYLAGILHDGFLGTLASSPQHVPDMLFRTEIYIQHRRNLVIACDKNSPLWQRFAAAYDQYFDTEPNKLETRNAPAKDYDRLSAEALLLDNTYRTTYVGRFQPQIDKRRPQSAGKSFGSKGQFPLLDHKGAVETKLLVDVRIGATDKPAMITHFMIDPVQQHILWLALQPYQEWDVKLQEPYIAPESTGYFLEDHSIWCSDVPPLVVRQPWLIAIDTRDGHTIHKINLGTVPGLWPQGSPETMRVCTFDGDIVIGMFANDTHLLVQICSEKLEIAPGKYKPVETALISINRATGAIQKLPQNPHIVSSQMVETNGRKCHAVAGLGDSFFILERRTDPLNGIPDNYVEMLWQFKPDAKPKLLAKSGRRPEESPFDAQDQSIKLLRVDGGRLLVASSWNHLAYYDPTKEKWDDAPERSVGEWRLHVNDIDTKAFRSTHTPYIPFRAAEDGNNTYQFKCGDNGTYADVSKTPGFLKFQISGGPMSDLPVSMKVPANYRARFQVDSDPAEFKAPSPTDHFEWITIADMARSNRVTPALLDQTDAHLVLAMRLAPKGTMHFDVSAPPYLPFLWIMDKKEAVAAMKRVQAK